MNALQSSRRYAVLMAYSILLVIVLCGCSDDDDPVALAQFEPEIVNVADSFSMQATGVKNVTTTVNYTWNNSATRATIDHSTTSDSGSAVLEIRDSAGTIVYSKTLSPSLNEMSTEGLVGDWTIQVKFTGYTGTLNFTVQSL